LRRDSTLWTDVSWDEYKLAVEIDGAQHIEDPLQRWDDMERDIDFAADGYRTLRFPAWLVRHDPERVARTIRRALQSAGYRG
jgi:very-short-patch-repair endonuclease